MSSIRTQKEIKVHQSDKGEATSLTVMARDQMSAVQLRNPN